MLSLRVGQTEVARYHRYCYYSVDLWESGLRACLSQGLIMGNQVLEGYNYNVYLSFILQYVLPTIMKLMYDCILLEFEVHSVTFQPYCEILTL